MFHSFTPAAVRDPQVLGKVPGVAPAPRPLFTERKTVDLLAREMLEGKRLGARYMQALPTILSLSSGGMGKEKVTGRIVTLHFL